MANDKNISKCLSYLLRHGAVKAGLNIRSDGFVDIHDVLQNVQLRIKNITLDDISRVVENNDKKRFTLKNFDGKLWIKANQGHSISKVHDLSLHLLSAPTFDIIHGTYLNVLKKIQREGLSRMNRNHIHFAKGQNFICGLRKSAEVFIYIDFQKSTWDGLQFFESENGVILCSGDENGYIKPKYFLKCVNNKGEVLLQN